MSFLFTKKLFVSQKSNDKFIAIIYYKSSKSRSHAHNSNFSAHGNACHISDSSSQYIHVIAYVALSKSFSLFFQFFSIALLSESIQFFNSENTSTIIFIFDQNSSLHKYL
ncbi:MAG: hypothetical protein Q8S84_02310 [bacterium]|nr:hypothetical protein [bacterium]MDP3380386.1 hypothetical protein [bacterium]